MPFVRSHADHHHLRRRSSDEWRKHTASKTAIAAALEEVRRNRVQT